MDVRSGLNVPDTFPQGKVPPGTSCQGWLVGPQIRPKRDSKCKILVPNSIRTQKLKSCNLQSVMTENKYEGWNFDFGNAAVTFDTQFIFSQTLDVLPKVM